MEAFSVADTPRSPIPTQNTFAGRTTRSRDSDATIDEMFERPSADPQVSPAQLPPLCDDADSDDELFDATYAATEYDLPFVSNLDMLSRTSSWIADLQSVPPAEEIEVPETQFTFVAPSVLPYSLLFSVPDACQIHRTQVSLATSHRVQPNRSGIDNSDLGSGGEFVGEPSAGSVRLVLSPSSHPSRPFLVPDLLVILSISSK